MSLGLRLGAAIVMAVVVAAPERYKSVRVSDGMVTVTTADGRTVTPAVDAEQVDAKDAKVSPDGRSVGWLALYPNCCTSDPIPLTLQLFRDGRVRAIYGHPAIFMWMFQDGGRRIAYEEETVHFGNPHYVLLNVETGAWIEDYANPIGPDNVSLPRVTEPAWVRALDDTYRVRH